MAKKTEEKISNKFIEELTKGSKYYNKMIGQNMMLVNSVFVMQRSFKMIPITMDCPYVECIYSPHEDMFVVISKVMKQSYHFVPKIDDNGDQIPVKGKPRPGQNPKPIKEERRLVDTFSEFYLMTHDEIENFIKLFAVNHDEFDYKQYFKKDEDNKQIFTQPKPDIVTSTTE